MSVRHLFRPIHLLPTYYHFLYLNYLAVHQQHDVHHDAEDEGGEAEELPGLGGAGGPTTDQAEPEPGQELPAREGEAAGDEGGAALPGQ